MSSSVISEQEKIGVGESVIRPTNSGSSDDDERKEIKAVVETFADETHNFMLDNANQVEPLNAKEAKSVKYKLWFYILFVNTIISLVLFIDKSTLQYASILGIFADTHIGKTEYNNLNTIFYCGYFIALYPGHYLMQRLPLAKFMSGTICVWSIIVFLHCTAYNYQGLIALRFFLGFAEAVIVPAAEASMSMFFTQDELATVQPIFWISCQSATLPSGFIAYGCLNSNSESVHPWQVFMIILGGMTFLLSIWVFFFLPDNPIKARFLNTREKVHVVSRVQESTGGSIEQKIFKREQFIEAVKDPISWLFGLQALTLMYGNNLSYQQNLLYVSLGVSSLGSTLVSAAAGGFSGAVCIFAAIQLRYCRYSQAWSGFFYCLPAIAGGIAMVTLPWDNKMGLLASLIVAGHTYGITYIIGLSWSSSSCCGYTKRLMRMAIFMVGYSIGSIISPQIWIADDAPRYYPAWISIICVSWVGTPSILLIIRFILARRNKERRRYISENINSKLGYIERVGQEGEIQENIAVDVSMLDLTDLQNKAFIYPL